MKQPSRRNSLPNGTLSCTSTAWYGERKRSSCARDADEEAPVVGEVLGHHAGARSPATLRHARDRDVVRARCRRWHGIGASLPPRRIAWKRVRAGLQRAPRARETRARPWRCCRSCSCTRRRRRVTKPTSGHVWIARCDSASSTVPVTPCGSNWRKRSPTIVSPASSTAFEADVAQRFGVRQFRRVGRAAVPFAQQMDSVHQSSPRSKVPRRMRLSRSASAQRSTKRTRLAARSTHAEGRRNRRTASTTLVAALRQTSNYCTNVVLSPIISSSLRTVARQRAASSPTSVRVSSTIQHA